MLKISEVRNDFEDEGLRYIDVWESEDDNAVGKCVAMVDMDGGKVIFIDNDYRLSPQVNEAIAEVKGEIDDNKFEPTYEKQLEDMLIQAGKVLNTLVCQKAVKRYKDDPRLEVDDEFQFNVLPNDNYIAVVGVDTLYSNTGLVYSFDALLPTDFMVVVDHLLKKYK